MEARSGRMDPASSLGFPVIRRAAREHSCRLTAHSDIGPEFLSLGGAVGLKSSSGKLGWWFRLVKPAFARGRRPGHVMRPILDRPERQKPPGSLPAAALPRRLLRGFVDARLVALAPVLVITIPVFLARVL